MAVPNCFRLGRGAGGWQHLEPQLLLARDGRQQAAQIHVPGQLQRHRRQCDGAGREAGQLQRISAGRAVRCRGDTIF